jgi:methylmalonyl-CoA mutase cobalamin-binding subunit
VFGTRSRAADLIARLKEAGAKDVPVVAGGIRRIAENSDAEADAAE